jgi:hypothetical protein
LVAGILGAASEDESDFSAHAMADEGIAGEVESGNGGVYGVGHFGYGEAGDVSGGTETGEIEADEAEFIA